MEPLSRDVLNTLQEANYIACLCTVSKESNPSGRFVKVTVSDDFTKLYVGNRKMDRAENEVNSRLITSFCSTYVFRIRKIIFRPHMAESFTFP